MTDSLTTRTRAFVSYSHADVEYLDRLHKHLAPYMRDQKIDVWDDTRIRPGAHWRDEIQRAIASAKVAILLVSADFLASDFIATDEVPLLLQAAEKDGASIFSVILSTCAFEGSKLEPYQTINAPSDPIIDMTRGKQEATWARLAKLVAQTLATITPAVEAPMPPPQSNPLPSPEPSIPLPTTLAPTPVTVAEAAPLPSVPPPNTTLLIYRGHAALVHAVAWSPDGKLLASASGTDGYGETEDNTVQVWDATTSQHLFTCEGHARRVLAVAWSPDSTLLASGGADQTIRLWKAAPGGDLSRLAQQYRYQDAVEFFSAATGKSISFFRTSSTVRAVAWSPNGLRLAWAGGGQWMSDEMNAVEVLDARGLRSLVTYKEHKSGVMSIAWSPNSRRLASGSDDKAVHVWEADTGKQLFTYTGHTGRIRALAWSPNGRYIASGSSRLFSDEDTTVDVWEAATGQYLLTYMGHIGGVTSLAWSPDGRHIASASKDKTVQVWEAVTGQPLFTYQGHIAAVSSVAWSPDGTRLASASEDKTVHVWSPDWQKGS